MAKYNPTPISTTLSNSAAAQINNNFENISDAIEKTLSRDGTTPNQMTSDFDMNHQDIINADSISTNTLIIDGVILIPGEGVGAGQIATQPEAEAGVDNTKIMTPLRSKQQIDARLATQAEAVTGSDNTKLMTPFRVEEHYDAKRASNSDADAGTDDEKFMSPVKVVRWFDNWMTKLWGSSSLSRTQRARWSDTVNLRDWLIPGSGPTNEAVNTAAMTALMTFLNDNPAVRTVEGNMKDIYRIGGGTQWTWPSNTRLMMNGAEFEVLSTLGASASTMFQFNSGCVVIGMRIHLLTGSALRRLVDFMTDNIVDDCFIYADSQINNLGASPLLDYAVRYRGHNQYIKNVRIKNIDRAHFAYGDGGDGVPSLGFKLRDLDAENYVTGLNLRNLLGASNFGYRSKGRSVNAAGDPGHNGMVHEGVAEYLLSDFIIKDSGEHGIRFGGTRNAEQTSRIITVGDGSIWRSGQSGFKMFTGVAGAFFKHVNVSNVNVVDCQYEPGSPGDLPGFNDEGFLLQQVQEGVFSGLRVSKQDNTTGFSCMDGVYISGANNVVIEGLQVMDPRRNALRISEFDGDTAPNSVEIVSNNEIMVRGMQAENVGENGIFIDHPSQSVRDLNIDAELIGNGAATFYGINGTAAAARYAQPCLFQLKSRNFAAGLNNLPATANVKVRDVFGAVY